MALTLKEWDEHFESLAPERRVELAKAIMTLEQDPTLKEQFGWTGLFALKYSAHPETALSEERETPREEGKPITPSPWR